jgi:hypothetical protein
MWGQGAGGEDKDFEEAISKVTTDQWALFLDAFELGLSSPPGVWHGLEALDSAQVGDVMRFPWLDSPQQLTQFVKLAYEFGLVVPFDWMSWPIPLDDGRVTVTSPIDAVKILTCAIRENGFNEGLLESLVSGGELRPVYMVLNATFGSARNHSSE